MACLRVSVFFSVALLCEALPTPPGTNPNGAGLLRQRSCPEGLYPSASLCCLNCPAGEHQVSPCSSDRGSSVCSECPVGTFTEHSNDLRTCLTCTRCRPDQEEVQPCSPTNDTVCRCKPGSFCAHDQACEVCQRCRSCNDGETRVKSCTDHSNSECAKTPTHGTPTEALWWILGVGVGFAVIGVLVYKKGRPWLTCLLSLSPGHSQQDAKRHGSLEIAQNAHNVLVEVPLLPPEKPRSDGSVDEEDLGLGSSSSETSLTVERTNLCTSTPPAQTPAGWTTSPPYARNDDDSLLVPLNGDMSLKHCFEYFDDDMVSKVHKRFFRRLDLSDKVIDRAINNVNNEDCVYELLGVWLEREGQEAKLHHLLQKVRDLDQNRTADSIVTKAIANGHYKRWVIPQPSYSGKSDE
ncbi:tumor necrosis factor receptor superfamily member 10B-like isoform X2 [Gadus macrocephalus]|uniref:tumor necrosis factor receptor superfamily member 10B-like isoform X2 n=1 Tax=Gadus macrocephalus TaxID=80720 RepID=UPI0028CB49E1|nr:tumor necrosis factor receptor superfamily member 10B-like isoform X2 [Gadus macrocephalus]